MVEANKKEKCKEKCHENSIGSLNRIHARYICNFRIGNTFGSRQMYLLGNVVFYLAYIL